MELAWGGDIPASAGAARPAVVSWASARASMIVVRERTARKVLFTYGDKGPEPLNPGI